MTGNETLNEREQTILQAVVQCYITTAEPVGSRTIVKRFGLELSPATVRNVMSDLEELGYLQQLHTSSGRVPTDKGYRYFVNYLMRVQELTLAERNRIDRELSDRLRGADEVLRHTSQMLALITHQTGIVKSPDEHSVEVRHIEVVHVASDRGAVLVADNYGRVHTVMMPLEPPLQGGDLGKLNRFLNDHLRGVLISRIPSAIEEVMRTLMDEQRRLAEEALQVVNCLPRSRPGQLYLEGTTQLFEQPEFHDVGRAREVFGLFEERDRLIQLLQDGIGDRSMTVPSVLIGSELHQPGLQEISVVTSPYRVGDRAVGVLGVLGPRRMPYPRLTAIVDYTAGMVSRFLTSVVG
ncbi:MAG: heat-inducible transcriptional repressor HrcA [Candidatus Hydrogenedentes bacterium]|nr:heat-inducible transcriptional repressor HrcA [Candidatus Hydrogenedentota bacterium]